MVDTLDNGRCLWETPCMGEALGTSNSYCSNGGCPSQVLVVLFRGDTFIDFCGHHYNLHYAALLADGFEVAQDDRDPGQRQEDWPLQESTSADDSESASATTGETEDPPEDGVSAVLS